MYTKTIVCLANSKKPPSGRCVAGREVDNEGFTQWIRPVSNRSSREVSEEERCYADGSDVRVLDIIDISFRRPEPEGHQTENHLIADDYYWQLRGRLSYSDLTAAAETPPTLWVNGQRTFHGQNDKIPVETAAGLRSSLYLIRPESLELRVSDEGYQTSRRRVRAWFEFAGDRYGLAVTDRVVEQRLLQEQDRHVTAIADAYLCVSLGSPYEGHAFKLIAAVITPDLIED